MVNKRVRNAVFGYYLKNDRMISVRFQDKPFNIMVIQVYAPTSNAEESEVEWFYEDLQDLLELTPKKDVLFIIGDWNAKVGSQETLIIREMQIKTTMSYHFTLVKMTIIKNSTKRSMERVWRKGIPLHC